MRSKSEAIFAACLDFAGWGFEYEPPTPLHSWDFWAHKTESQSNGPFVMLERSVYIEYKPRRPTTTYINNLVEKVRPWAEQHAANGKQLESYVVWGSPLSDQGYNFVEESPFVCYPIFTKIGKYGWGDFCPIADSGDDAPFSYRHPQTEIIGITGEHIKRAMAYRFDLKT